MVNSEFKEIEYKYSSDNISLSSFTKLMEEIKDKYKFNKFQQASSFDTYYVKDGTDEFQRFRNDGKTPELTKKRKVKNSNNWERIESDLPLDPNRITEEKVTFHLGLDGYKYRCKIYKVCFIYWYDEFNCVWYSVYDKDMKELGRFVEIELNKDKLSCLTNPSESLRKYEQEFSVLGISPQNRMKKSLYELYVKE